MLMENGPRAWRAFDHRVGKAKEIARAAGQIVAEEAMTWDLFRWTVIVLLVLNFILLAYDGSKSDRRRDHHGYASDELSSLRAEMSEMAAELAAVRFHQYAPQEETEPTTGSIGTPSIPLPTRSPRLH